MAIAVSQRFTPSGDLPVEAGRYRLVAAGSCPWCRRVLIALTDQGRHSVETALETHLENCRAVAERLDVEEVQQLNRLLAKMLPADSD